MRTKKIQNVSSAINSINHFLDFSPHKITILYGLSEIVISDDTMMSEIHKVFAKQKSKLEEQLAALIKDRD